MRSFTNKIWGRPRATYYISLCKYIFRSQSTATTILQNTVFIGAVKYGNLSVKSDNFTLKVALGYRARQTERLITSQIMNIHDSGKTGNSLNNLLRNSCLDLINRGAAADDKEPSESLCTCMSFDRETTALVSVFVRVIHFNFLSRFPHEKSSQLPCFLLVYHLTCLSAPMHALPNQLPQDL